MLFPSVNTQKSWLVFVLIILVALNLFFNYSFQGSLEDRAKWLDSLFGRTLYPVQWVFNQSEEGIRSSGAKVGRLWSADKENQELKNKIALLELRVHDFEEVKGENARLQELLGFRPEPKRSFIPTRIVGRDVSQFFRTVEIDRGFEDGIEPGMAVVSPAGAVGRVLRTAPRSSSVLLISDINSKIEAIVQRSRTRVIVGGAIDGNLTLRFLPRRYDVRQGDEIVSTDLGGQFPPGIRVGVIVGLGEDPNLVLQSAELEPAVNFDSLEEVFVAKVATK